MIDATLPIAAADPEIEILLAARSISGFWVDSEMIINPIVTTGGTNNSPIDPTKLCALFTELSKSSRVYGAAWMFWLSNRVFEDL